VDRVMFGSDWPVCTLVAFYDEVVGALRTVLDRLGPLTPETQRKIWGETAARWYRLAG
jgi:L-fuconolactonase